jgi:hypothetical protein
MAVSVGPATTCRIVKFEESKNEEDEVVGNFDFQSTRVGTSSCDAVVEKKVVVVVVAAVFVVVAVVVVAGVVGGNSVVMVAVE